MRAISSVFAIVFFTGISNLAAEIAGVTYRTIRVTGRLESIVTEKDITLGDVADIASPRLEDDESVLALRKIMVAVSPKPGEVLSLRGEDILSSMKREGVKLDQVAYSLPSEVKVSRAYREIPLAEIERAVDSMLKSSGRDIQVKNFEYAKPFKVAPHAAQIQAIAIKPIQPGQVGIDLQSTDGSNDARFQLRAMVDEWKLIAIAGRSVSKGSAFTGADIEMRNFNTALIGRDVLESPSDVIGAVASREIGAGEPLRKSMLTVPPTIASGSKVIILFKSGFLEASASGTALENGMKGQAIRVKNDNSQKIVTGVVSEAGLVNVSGDGR